MNGDSANKFISALVKSLQTLCHGYVEFNDGIEIIGHLYLNIDSGASFDYVVKEKVCKNAENSTVFVSKSFQAQAPAEECITRKDKDDEAVPVFEESSEMSPTTGTSRLQSAITSISNVLSGSQHDVHKSRMLDHSSHHSPVQNNGKRKREHNGSYSGLQPPYKYTTLQATPSTYFNTPSSSTKQAVDRNHSSEHFNNSSHAEFFGGDSNQSSGMGREDEDDLDLDVTFVKEEYESQRNSGQRGVSAGGASRLSQDPSSNQSNILHDGGTLGYQSTNHHQAPQQFASGTAVELGTSSQNFTDPSQVDLSQHSSQSSQNPRSDVDLSRHMDCTLSGMALDFTSSPFNSSNMSGISDTLQLGIKLFGPTFVADVASGDLSLPLTTLTDENRALPEPVNASVFPEMFDVTTVSSSSLKPNQKVLWHDRKDKLRRSILMRKANSTKIRNRSSAKKVACNENEMTGSPVKTLNTFSEGCSILDPLGLPFKRKRGRPPKILKMICRSEFLLEGTSRDPVLGHSVSSENSEADANSIVQDLALSDRITPSRSIFLSEGSSKRIRGSYRQYTPADKLKIVEFGIKYGSTAASRKYNIPESTVRSWTKKMDIFLMQMKNEQKSQESSHSLDVLETKHQSLSKNNEEAKTSVTEIQQTSQADTEDGSDLEKEKDIFSNKPLVKQSLVNDEQVKEK
ncbi:zinc finger and BTB domain-containing protein 5-like isoform X43 [Biomphalaria pfeifferi]|uniref:Zinc finger and BTB domain-containing protein 5-like isoform X43 n=1 Tax=Biomphalaria pfeifferi TaxID=112525 RepID=A0AAD8FM94_BIOPF|nr:zinc finger and BTB domain-containing protein 5-like isoform X43 [Biomphalaria pfeifferi]